jgi:alkylation response protein AidB-like acyl-CoA dehydrogenase
MEFELNEEQKMIKKMARDLAEKEILPIVNEIEEKDTIPPTLIQKLAHAGALGMEVSTRYGGSESGVLGFIIACEEISYINAGCGSFIGVENSAAKIIEIFGSEGQKEKYIPMICQGQGIASFAFTEPNTGSDPKAIVTKAKRAGDHYVINGYKRFITNSDADGPIILLAKTEDDRLTAFLFEKNITGYSALKPWEKMGRRGPHVCDIEINELEIPQQSVLGDEGEGFEVLLRFVTYSKLGLCISSVGIAQAALDESIKYAKERLYRETPIAEMQAIQWLLAEMAAKVEAGRWLTYRTAYLADKGNQNIIRESALTKLFASQMAVDVVRMGLQVHGPYGFMKEFKIERFYRDAKGFEVIEGTNEIQRSIVGTFLVH